MHLPAPATRVPARLPIRQHTPRAPLQPALAHARPAQRRRLRHPRPRLPRHLGRPRRRLRRQQRRRRRRRAQDLRQGVGRGAAGRTAGAAHAHPHHERHRARQRRARGVGRQVRPPLPPWAGPAARAPPAAPRLTLQPAAPGLPRRWGSAATPLVIQAEGGSGAATLSGYVSLSDCRYLYLLGVRFAAAGRVMQVRGARRSPRRGGPSAVWPPAAPGPCRPPPAACSAPSAGWRWCPQIRSSGYVLLRNVVLAGGAGSSEVLDVAGSQAIYLEGTRVTGGARRCRCCRCWAAAGPAPAAAARSLRSQQLSCCCPLRPNLTPPPKNPAPQAATTPACCCPTCSTRTSRPAASPPPTTA
jgi:hypothetical protein